MKYEKKYKLKCPIDIRFEMHNMDGKDRIYLRILSHDFVLHVDDILGAAFEYCKQDNNKFLENLFKKALENYNTSVNAVTEHIMRILFENKDIFKLFDFAYENQTIENIEKLNENVNNYIRNGDKKNVFHDIIIEIMTYLMCFIAPFVQYVMHMSYQDDEFLEYNNSYFSVYYYERGGLLN